MAVLSGATASGRQFFGGAVPAATTTLYTAPAASANVTAPSATAYIKEIVINNSNAIAVSITINVAGFLFLNGLVVAPNDTKVLTGLNTMIPAGQTITGSANAAASITLIISGVEVQ